MMTVHVRFLVSKRCGTRRGMFLHFSLDLCTLDVRVWLPSNIQIFSLGAGHTMHGTLTTSYHTSIV